MIKIRVRGKTSSDYRHVEVSNDGEVIRCNCQGFDGLICSHIDAVLIAGERAMVLEEDWQSATTAMKLVSGKLSLPEYWRGTWRRELSWRGLSKGVRAPYVRRSSQPLVCFTGNCGKPRAVLISEAKANGWDTVNSPSPHLDVLVAAGPTGNSAKLKVAREHAIPIVAPDEWESLISDGELPTS